MSKTLRYISFTLLFFVSFLFFIYLMFPFNILKERLVMGVTKATGLNLTVYELSPSLPLGIEAKEVSLKSATGEELKFSEVDVSLNPFYIFVGQVKCTLELYDVGDNELDVAVKFSLLSLISDVRNGRPAVPSWIRLTAKNYILDDVSGYALSSYANSPATNQLIVPLLQQMEIRGNLNADVVLNLDLEDPTSSDGSLDLNIGDFVLALNAPDLNLEDQKFESASVKADLSSGSLKIKEGSEFSSQDIAMQLSGDLSLKSPILTSTMNLAIPLQIKGALKDQFGFLINAVLKGTSDGKIPLQVRGTLGRPSVSYN